MVWSSRVRALLLLSAYHIDLSIIPICPVTLAATSARAASARRIWSAASTSCASRNASYTTQRHVKHGRCGKEMVRQ